MTDKSKQASLMTRASNAIIGFLVGTVGVNIQGAAILEVRGRKSGNPHRVPVNPVTVDRQRYLFSPRGESAWVKNIRVAHEGILQRGRKVERVQVEEIPDDRKVPIIRAYLNRWYWQVGKIVGVPKDADDAALAEIASRHPIFRIVSADESSGS